MATRTADSTPTSVSAASGGGQRGKYVDGRLNKTRFQIKLADLISALMLLLAGVLSFLLVVSLVDHWVAALGFGGRLLALTILVVAVLCYGAWRALPLVVHGVNPVYAARVIEQSQPSLKNSLINFLMIRSDRASVRTSVYEAMEHKAASDLSQVKVEAAVDRSQMILIGYVLAGVMAAWAAYKILSPKDPFQTVARVLSPWSDIARPSRVQIEDVQPGNEDVYQGQLVTVSARVRGAGDSSSVTLFYSTADGQIVNQSVAMRLSEDGLRRQCEAPPGESGVQQDMVYRIEAGDAKTPDFRLTVRPAPAVFVQQVEYTYPAYTGRPPLVVERQGDIRALEGTRVKIRARANQQIRSAYIELDPDSLTATRRESGGEPRRAETAPMQVQGRQAWGELTLELNADRKTPKHTAYQIRFVTREGWRNEQPVLHQIEVVRDLSPEVEILVPQQDRITLPENGRQIIQIRAVDPDYGLRNVALRAVSSGEDVIDARLLEKSNDHQGQVVVDFPFEPAQYGLAAGDRIVYWAVAEDNRTSGRDAVPEPNAARTRNYHIEIVAAQSQEASETAPKPEADPNGQPSKEREPQAKDDQGRKDPGSAEADSRSKQDADAAPQEKPSDQPGEKPQGKGQEDQAASSGEKPGEKTPQKKQSPEGGPQQASPEREGGDASGKQDQPGQQGQPSEQNQAGKEGAKDDGPTGPGAPNQQESGTGDSAGGDSARQKSGDSKAQNGQEGPAGSGQEREQPSSDSQREEPLHDGEIIEKINEYRQRQEAQKSSQQADQGSQAGAAAENRSDQAPPADGSPSSKDQADDQQSAAGQQRGAAQSEAGRPAAQQEKGAAEEGGQPQPAGQADGQRQTGQGEKPIGSQEKPGSGGQSDSGGNQSARDERGTPPSGQASRDREKTMNSEKTAQSDKAASEGSEQSQSPSGGEQGSESSPSESGDQRGKGGKGDDRGANGEKDDGPSDSSAAGDSAKPQQSDTARGSGDEQRSQTPGEETGGQASDGQTQRAAKGDGGAAGRQDGTSPSSESSDKTTEPGRPDSQPLSGGRAGSGLSRGPEENDGKASGGDEANLQYARKATDMALEYLKDRQDSPDPDLLKELQWTAEDWRKFLERWERLMQSAEGQREPAQRERDESLRSLGLRPAGEKLRRGGGRADGLRGLHDAGGRSTVPPAYREQFDAYKKGAARTEGVTNDRNP